MKNKEELMKLKEDVANIQARLKELTDEELEQIFSGMGGAIYIGGADVNFFNCTFTNNSMTY